MKFFRQTKETKRKISFFMALAMVISLLPVSPVAKAESKADFTVYCNVSGAAVSSVTSPTTGCAVIILTGNDNREITDISKLKAEVVSNTTVTGSATATTIPVITSGSAVAITKDCISGPAIEENGTVKITVSKITKDDSVILSGEVTLDTEEIPTASPSTTATSGATTEPTKKPGTTTEPTKDPDATTTPGGSTATPVPTHDVTITKNVGENIKLSVNGSNITENSSTIKIENGKVIPVEITPADNYVWDTPSTVEVNGTNVDLTNSGTKYSTNVTINKNTNIVVSGGSVLSVSDVTDKIESEPAPGNKDGATIAIDSIKEDIVNAIIKDNPNVSTSAIIAALASGSAITTTYKISEASSDGALTTIKDNFNNLQSTLGEEVSPETFNKAITDGYTVDITIDVTYSYNGESKNINITILGKEVQVTMPIPDSLKGKDTTKGAYYAFRIHDGEVTAIPCEKSGDNLTFNSDKFSTYVISFVEKDTTPSTTTPPTPTPTPTTKPTNKPGTSGGNSIGTYPSSGTPAPSATAAPSAKPSAKPDNTNTPAPGTDNTAAPSETGAPTTGDNTTPTKAPTATDKPNDTGKDDTPGATTVPTVITVGKKATVSGSQYKVTAVKGTRTVQFTKGKKNAKSIVVPSTVKISGKNYKVTTIAKNAFKGNKKLTKVTIGKNVNKIGTGAFQNCSKLKSIVIKSTKLTAKKVGKNAFKGINKKATFKVPKSKVKAYKKIVKAKGAGKNVKVKK